MATRWPTAPPDQAEDNSPAAFPDLAGSLNPNIPAASDVARQIWPYNRYARSQNGPAFILKPTAAQTSAVSSDSDMDVVRQQLQSIARSERLRAAPWLTPPPDVESFHLAAGIALPAISATVFTVVVSITVPPGRNGVLNQIANLYEGPGAGFIDFTGDVVWQITRNSPSGGTAPERNYENIQASLGTPAAPGRIAPIRIFENDVISLVVRNANIIVASQVCGGLLGGWFYARTWDDQFDREDQSLSW